YESDRWTPTTFNTRVFVYSLGDSVSSMRSVFPSSPSRSSGAGGGSSGFGVGGFSGGGFGGGGGGGWWKGKALQNKPFSKLPPS
ncbi:MAG: hypothetical protein N2116_04835, partial [Armatimonadetes bacterium]|nr:hypothetical protein [Armatimonadota bacterium]